MSRSGLAMWTRYSHRTPLKTVRTVKWYTGSNDPLWLQEIIWRAIEEFPNLRHLTIDSSFLQQPLGNFGSLNALESIKISGKPFKRWSSISQSFETLCCLIHFEFDHDQTQTRLE